MNPPARPRLPPSSSPARRVAGAALLALAALGAPGVSAAATLAGTVRSSATGQGLGGALVVAYDLRLSYQYTVADSSGAWVLDDLPAGAWRLRVLPANTSDAVSRFWPATRDFCSAELLWLEDDQTRDGIDFSLEAGATLSGQIVDQLGDPVPDVVITATGADATVAGSFREALTDDQGRFTLHGLDVVVDDQTDWYLQAALDGWPVQYLGQPGAYDQDDADIFSVEAGAGLDVGSLALLDGIALGGVVRGPDGPVDGATVHAYASGQIVSVQTDDSGRYDAVGLPPGSALVWSSPEGLATTYYPDVDRPDQLVDVLDEGAVRDDLDLDAPAEAVLEAVFTGAGSGVRGMLYNSTYTVGKGSSTDDDGVLRIDGLHGGSYTLFAWGYNADLVNRWIDEVDGEPTPFDIEAGTVLRRKIELEPGARVSGQLLDDYDAPVYGGVVHLIPEQGDTWTTGSARDGTWTLGGLPGGLWELEVSYGPYCSTDPGYVPLVWPGEPDASRSEALDLAGGEHVAGLDFAMPRDDDHDGMSDRWELSWGLDDTRDDSAEDPDGDGYTNLEEYLLGTDPLSADAGGGGCGCSRSAGSGAAVFLLPLLGLWRRRRDGGPAGAAAR